MSVYLLNLSAKLDAIGGLSSFTSSPVLLWKKICDSMDESSTLWLFVTNRDDDRLGSTAMRVGQQIQNETELSLRDIITVHTQTGNDGYLKGIYEEILLFVKDTSNYSFDKDSIRVKPVYKGKEWNGHRSKGKSAYRGQQTKRYNPEGKDPGNVWLNEIRTETDSRVLDRIEPIPREEAIRRCVRVGVDNNGVVYTLWADKQWSDVIESEGATEKKLENQIEVGNE